MQKFFILSVLLLTSCASYQSGKEAKLENSDGTKKIVEDIKVTAERNREFSTPHFSYIQVDFGNKTDEWFDISKVRLNIADDTIKIILGDRLVDVSQGLQNMVAIDRHNQQMVLGAIAGVAFVGAASSGSSNSLEAMKSYSVVMAGAAVASDVNTLTDKISDLERAKIFPKNHLYSPFTLPPGLVNKRWIIVQHAPNVRINNLAFDVFPKKGKKRRYSVPLY